MFRPKNENLDYLGDDLQQVSRGKLRRLFVGANYSYYRNIFRYFDKNGGYLYSFNKHAAWFGVAWMLYRRLYIEAGIVFAAILLLSIIVCLFAFTFKITFLIIAFIFHIALGYFANYIYWLKASSEAEEGYSFQEVSLYDAHEKVRKTGGVDIFSSGALFLLAFLFLSSNIYFWVKSFFI